SPSAALRCMLRRCYVPPRTLRSGGFAPGRAERGRAFHFAIRIFTFYEIIKRDGGKGKSRD
ncbi:MAG: hypothetical protein NTY64_05010, partial [Deltaproteobacteria bacterium]|nr:hypothetical protein [Deltaproteobacteria bacterium]